MHPPATLRTFLRLLAGLRKPSAALVAVGMFCLGLIVVATDWKGLSAIAFYLVSIISLPAIIVAAFPKVREHVKHVVRAVLLSAAAFVLVFAATFVWALTKSPVYVIGVSLPFRTDWNIARETYDAIHDQFERENATFVDKSRTRMILNGREFKIMPFDDSDIGDQDCTEPQNCKVWVYDDRTDSKELDKAAFRTERYFADIVADPHVVGIIGPYNSGVALRQIPAVNRAHVPLVSPANTADCLTDPAVASGDCDAEKLRGDSYFRIVTRDGLRQKTLADYLWEEWRRCVLRAPAALGPEGRCPPSPPDEPKVVIFSQSGPKASTFTRGASDGFIAAWAQHTSLKPTVYPVADASGDGDLAQLVRRLDLLAPDIIVYSGTGRLGARLYDAVGAGENHRHVIFAVPAGTIRYSLTDDVLTAGERAGRISVYVADFAATAPRNKYESVYAACAYDAAGMLLKSIFAAQDNDRGYRLRSSVDEAFFGLMPTHLGARFRQAVGDELRWINTAGHAEYHGLTGTYSFNGNDVDGAPGITISTYEDGEWVNLPGRTKSVLRGHR